MRVDLEEVRDIVERRRRINSAEFENIEWYENGERLDIPKETLDEWLGLLNNIDFITSGYYLKKKTYTCTVCGYNQLEEPPEDHMICPCCSTHFGYSDDNWGVDALREEWIKFGMKWWSERTPSPVGWNPRAQLLNIGIDIKGK